PCPPPPTPALCPYTTLFRSLVRRQSFGCDARHLFADRRFRAVRPLRPRAHVHAADTGQPVERLERVDGVGQPQLFAHALEEPRRSEEHTSELQSREISYAVF